MNTVVQTQWWWSKYEYEYTSQAFNDVHIMLLQGYRKRQVTAYNK